MDEIRLNELIDTFNLKNDLTKNENLWIGHAKIGYRKRMDLNEAIEFLKDYFQEHIPQGQKTPEYLQEILKQWEGIHQYQKVREADQPMFFSKANNKVYAAVIWPWQIREGVASLMLYVGEL